MYSKYDDTNYRPAPGERERDRVRFLYIEAGRLSERLKEISSEIAELESHPNFFDIPLPDC